MNIWNFSIACQNIDRPANRGRYGNFSDDGPRGNFDRNQREGSYGNRDGNNQRDDR